MGKQAEASNLSINSSLGISFLKQLSSLRGYALSFLSPLLEKGGIPVVYYSPT